MSYEGYEQYLCSDGHYWTEDCWSSSMYSDRKPSCPHCKKPAVFGNAVDQTNGPDVGRVILKEIAPAKICTCKCGYAHASEPARFAPLKDDKGNFVFQPSEEEDHV